MDEAPSPQLICEFCIVPEVAVTVAVTVLPAVIAVGETARDVVKVAATVTFSDCMYALPSLSQSFTTTRWAPGLAVMPVSKELAFSW